MNRSVSRREFAAGIVLLPIATAVRASERPAEAVQETAAGKTDRERLEAMLARPFDPADSASVQNAVKAIADLTGQRLKTRLQEGSEPCTMYVPTRAQARR